MEEMKTSVIIPAYNEQQRIVDVIRAVDGSDWVGEIIVVNDGSTDRTSEIVRNCGIETKLISLAENKGKYKALTEGVKRASYSTLVFMDADLVGLEPKHINDMVKTYIRGGDVVVGVFHKGRLGTDISQKLFPHLSGQRVLSVDIWEKLNKSQVEQFGIEMALTKVAFKENLSTVTVKLDGVSHVLKEEKRGFIEGIIDRFKMYRDIIKAFFTPTRPN